MKDKVTMRCLCPFCGKEYCTYYNNSIAIKGMFACECGATFAKEFLGLNHLAKEVHQNAKDHGWWDEERTFGEIIALMHSELSEALEEYRNGKPNIYFVRETSENIQFGSYPVNETDLSKLKGEKLEGAAVELADCIIRILDYCGRKDIDIDTAVRLKHEYNKSRPYKHGGKKI